MLKMYVDMYSRIRDLRVYKAELEFHEKFASTGALPQDHCKPSWPLSCCKGMQAMLEDLKDELEHLPKNAYEDPKEVAFAVAAVLEALVEHLLLVEHLEEQEEEMG